MPYVGMTWVTDCDLIKSTLVYLEIPEEASEFNAPRSLRCSYRIIACI